VIDAHAAADRQRYVVGVDIGGTCTDCMIMDDAGRSVVAKAFSTPPDFSRGIISALEFGAAELDLSLGQLVDSMWLFLHSTTVAENAIADGAFARAGLITTSGFRDTLFATRGGFGRWSGLSDDEKRNPIETAKPPPLVPLTRIRTVRERVDRAGAVVVALDEEETARVVTDLLDEGVDAVGVCLLWSFAHREHELIVRDSIARVRPDIFVSLSHELAPVVGENERTSTVALNAALGPLTRAYLDGLRLRLAEHSFNGTFLVMQAHGGLLSLERARDRPVSMIESGPVSGLIGSRRLGRLVGLRNIISADMGGTTFKVGVVRDGAIDYQHESQVFRYHYALPKMDVTSLGLAGGSVISFDERTGIPQIGPRGAGSYPGPVVYGHGGVEPTVTDVDAILGFMHSGYFLGGREKLDTDAAREVFEEKIAGRLGLPLLDAAGALYKLTNTYIYDLLHRTTVQRGLDPRLFVLFATGGTAAMHLPVVGDELGVRKIVVPYTASVHGAFGLLTSDVVHEELLTKPTPYPASPEVIEEVFSGLEQSVRRQLSEDGFHEDEIAVSRSVDMHFRRQVHEVTVPVRDDSRVDESTVEELAHDFVSLYKERFGEQSTWPGAAIDFVTFRVRGSSSLRQPELERLEEGAGTADDALVEHREVFLPLENRLETVPGFDLSALPVGARIEGPALIWSTITTIVIGSRQLAVVDPYRNIIIERAKAGQ
jgi:N-methylhydantoinase A